MATKKTLPADNGGYKAGFLSGDTSISLPQLTTEQKKDLVKFKGTKYKLDYIHYSVVMCKSRKLAFFTAVNIDGQKWQDNNRVGSFKNDTRLKADEQLGSALYSAMKNDFDKGHLVRREDPEWGDKELSKKAGKNTFWYTNCAPQHKKLNQEIWADLEANILHTGATGEKLKCSVFTGPVLAENDGVFIKKVKGENVKIPNLFWKVVVWAKSNGKTCAVSFLQSQEKFLLEDGIIIKPVVVSLSGFKKMKNEDIFEYLKFKDGKTYQVRIEEIEKLTGLKFKWPGVQRPYKKMKPKVISGTPIPEATIKKAKALSFARPDSLKMTRTISIRGLVLG